MRSQWGHKNYFKDWCFSLLFLFWTIVTQWNDNISKGHKPENFETHSSQKHILTNIWGLFFSILLDVNLSLNQTLLTFTIDSNNFSVKGYLPLIQKDSLTLVCLVLHGLRFAQDLSLGNSSEFYMFLTGFTLFIVLLLLPQLINFFIFMHSFWWYW